MSRRGNPGIAEAGQDVQCRTPAGLLGRLMAAVRPEFRASELVFDPRDPVFGGKPCLVPGRERPACGHGLCHGHRQRWAAAGRPDVREFTEPTASPWRKNAPLSRCQAPGCRYGVGRRKGLCIRHSGAREKAGTPALPGWLDAQPGTMPAAPPADCLIGSCKLRAEPGSDWCRSHGATWKRHGRPPAAEFTAQWAEDEPGAGRERIRLDSLPAQLKPEVQYALQCRHDERAGKALPYVVMITVRFLASSGASSLLDRPEQEWRTAFGKKRSNATALLAWSRLQVTDLAQGAGWDAEYPRDAWQIAIFLHARGIIGADGIGRAVLEDYLAGLHAAMGGRPEHGAHVSTIGLFLTAVRQHGWAPALPPDAMIFPGDQPPRTGLLPRALAGHVMAQVEQPGNLAREENPAYRLVTLILIRCGLRVSDALRLPSGCTVTDDSGAPYLRYRNHKMKREALVPVDDELLALIRGQQQRVLDRYPAGPVLFPRPAKNPDGKTPVSSSTYRLALYRWLERCDVRDEHGQPVHLTPHQWRHTLGTVLINRDVPQHVVQKVLDHDSPLMTAHYARLSDNTVREHWERARKVGAAVIYSLN